MKIIFFGTPDVCIPFLNALHTADLAPSVIVTAPDRPAGRGHKLTPPPVKVWAQTHNTPMLQPEKITDDFLHILQQYNADVYIVVAYGVILPKALIELPKHNTLNVHFSLLPRWRGASPVEAAILGGDTHTGCAIQIMQPKLDTGPVIAQNSIEIGATETAPQLRARLASTGAQLLVDVLPNYVAGNCTPTAQNDADATYAGKFTKADGDITHDDDTTRWRKYRTYAQWPQTYFFAKRGEKTLRVKVTEATFENGVFVIQKVIPEGKKEMPYTDFLRQTSQ